MDDDNGLELSLGLSCGGGKATGSNNNPGTSSENHNVEGGGSDNRSAKVIDDFKNFLHPTPQRPPAPEPPSSEPQQPPQNFFNELSKAPSTDAEASTKPLWVEDDAGSSKRKLNDDDEKKKDNVDKKTKASHVSNATDEGSTADNEDVAESESGGGGGAKEVDNIAGQRKNNSEEFTTNRYTVPFTVHHQQNVITGLPYSLPAKESGQHAAAATSLTQPVQLPVMFGYSPVQLPILDKDGPSNTGTGKQPVAEEGSSERPVEDNNNISTAFSFDFSAIKPGMAADVKFGGSGARPNLPWVSTTGSGPHGRTISGVTYRYNANQIKIVCACHGSHMSPEEFVRHASEEYVNPESSVGMSAASAHT